MRPLLAHQVKFRELSKERLRYGLFWKPGTTKTSATLAAIEANPIKTVTVCPKSVIESAWLGDAEHFPALRVVKLTADNRNRVGLIRSVWDVCVTNPEMFKKHVADFLAVGVRRMVFDESDKLRNHESAISRATVAFSDRMESFYALSGTPAPNSATEYWTTLRCILGVNGIPPYWRFCFKYFFPQKERICVRGGQWKDVVRSWAQTDSQRTEFEALLRSCSWVLKKEDCIDLPPKLEQVRDVELSIDEATAYRAAEDELRMLVDGGESQRLHASAALMKLRQIVGGQAYLPGGGVETYGSSKIEVLDEVLDELRDEPTPIWAQFKHEKARIVELCQRRGESVAVIDSENAGELTARFQAGEIKRLVCHPDSIAHGATLHRASYAVYYSLDFSSSHWEQSQDRIHRFGMSDKPATYTILRAVLPTGEERETVDHAMLRVVRRKGSASDAILETLKMVPA